MLQGVELKTGEFSCHFEYGNRCRSNCGRFVWLFIHGIQGHRANAKTLTGFSSGWIVSLCYLLFSRNGDSHHFFLDDFTRDFPIRAFYMDNDNREVVTYVNGKAEYPSPVDPGLLDIPYVYPVELENSLVSECKEANSWGVAAEVMIEWFSKSWLSLGGDKFSLKATYLLRRFKLCGFNCFHHVIKSCMLNSVGRVNINVM
jgi:hypothetical protein